MNLEQKLLKKYPKLNKKTVALVVKKVKATPKNQRGTGFLDKTVNKAVDLYNRALFRKKDKRDHVLKDGEKHLLFLNEKGALVRGRFAGPSTDIVGNLKELLKKNNNEIALAIADDNFVSDADKVAMAHDIRYSIRTNPDEVREADLKFVNKLKDNMKKAGLRNPRILFNHAAPLAGVRTKMLAEDAGLIKKGSLAGEIPGISKEDEKLLEDTLAHLEMTGYGKRTDDLKSFLEKNRKALVGVSSVVVAALAAAAAAGRDTRSDAQKKSEAVIKRGQAMMKEEDDAKEREQQAKLDAMMRKAKGPLRWEKYVQTGGGMNYKRVVSDFLGVPLKRVKDSSRLREDLGADDIEVAEIINHIEFNYDCNKRNFISETSIRTVLDVKNLISGCIRGGSKDFTFVDSPLERKETKTKVRPPRTKARPVYTSNSKWVAHVRAYAKEHGLSYNEAMSKAKASYKK